MADSADRGEMGEPFAGRIDHQRMEAKWRKRWEEAALYDVDLAAAARPYYNLMMFPYPSAEGLHVGNVYAFCGSDIHGRFMAMHGYDVFEPMGFDAFGIHSENYALKIGMHPKSLTARNVERFRETQLKRIGNRFDWQHEVQTTDPHYYKWTQWLFIQLYKAGLATRKRAAVNWCPTCKTVLADEQVIAGRCERCESAVIQRELEQWFFGITRYAQKLLDNLAWLDWSDSVTKAQRRWIGRSAGAELALAVVGRSDLAIEVYTTRPDTILGMTFVVLAPEHPLVDQLTTPEHRDAVQTYRQAARGTSELERLAGERGKTGVFTGAYAVNPVNGEAVPIWIAAYVLLTYGTGAIQAVPAHDARDFAFAEAFGLEIREVVCPGEAAGHDPRTGAHPRLAAAFSGHGVMVNAGRWDGLRSEDCTSRVIDLLEEAGRGARRIQYRLRDWLISRQRYWGPPIPIIYCDRCGTVPVPEQDLPVLLPDLDDYVPTGTGSSPLAHVERFVNVACPHCGGPGQRETDVSDNFLDSAWYFLRYPSSQYAAGPWEPAITRTWLPVDMYIGGPEHAVLHLLYTRFLCMALHDLGLLDFEEPFKTFRAHGIITKDGAKMSKSKGNVVNPDDYIERFGADTLRTYLMFVGPYDQGGDFSDRGIGGVARFLTRVATIVELARKQSAELTPSHVFRRAMHRTIQRVTEDVRNLKYNTAIAALMEYVNVLLKQSAISRQEAEAIVLLSAPFAPYLAEELWERLGKPFSVHRQSWPAYDPNLARLEQIEIVVQVNGRRRDVIAVEADADEEYVKNRALSSVRVQPYVENRSIKRLVYVNARLVNIVV
jgi:leucyl-tRNA synthetase